MSRWLPALGVLLACHCALAQDLPPAEISSAGITAGDNPVGADPVSARGGAIDTLAGTGPATTGTTEDDYIVIHSTGYSRFEIADNGDILVVYRGGVEFSYRGYDLRADELSLDQATRAASASGDVQFSSKDVSITTQQVELDGGAGRGSISGHLVGTVSKSGIRFEADRAELSFPPGSTELAPEQTQLTLSGSVAVFTRSGAELRTDQVALDGATRRFSTAPFTLASPLGNSGAQLQVTGTALGGLLTEQGQPAEISVLGLLAVSQLGRMSAARAVAHPDATGKLWTVDVNGAPLRLELPSRQVKPPGAKTKVPTGPILLESPAAQAVIDGEGVLSASLTNGVTIAGAGNRLAAGSVSVDRREQGYAVSLGQFTLGLDLAKLTGIEPVDLSELIK